MSAATDPYLRPTEATDLAFCRQLFGVVRTDEMQAWHWDAAMRASMLDMQFSTHEAQLRARGDTDDRLVLAGTQAQAPPIGRLVLVRQADALHVADLSLLPEWRGQGIGSGLLRRLQQQASASGLPLRLFCLCSNPALALYLRLGFRADGGDGVHAALAWRGAAGALSGPHRESPVASGPGAGPRRAQ